MKKIVTRLLIANCLLPIANCLLPIASCLLPIGLFSQPQNVGIGTYFPHPSAQLDISAASKGILIPRLGNPVILSMLSPAEGLLVYNTTFNAFYYFNGSIWKGVSESSNSWGLTGNAGTNPLTQFIGTTDDQPIKFRLQNFPSGLISKPNIFIGLDAGNTNTATGIIGIGRAALKANGSNVENTAIGDSVMYNNLYGSGNTGIGFKSMRSAESGYYNTAVGAFALTSNKISHSNTAMGYQALRNTINSGNTGIGSDALRTNTSGVDNTAIGANTLTHSLNGSYNTAVGRFALELNSTGNYNTAIGVNALQINTESSNTAVGWYSLNKNISGASNTGIGNLSLQVNNSGYANTGAGSLSLYWNTSGNYNTAVGHQALISNETGNNNSSIGYYSGTNQKDISNRVYLGNTSVNWIGGQVGWSTYSDIRIKENIKDDVPGLAFITKLQPVSYNLNIHKQNELLYAGITDEFDWPEKYDIEKMRMAGFIAQDVEKAAMQSGYNFPGIIKPLSQNDLYSLRYGDFIIPLVKAVQEQQEQIKFLVNQNSELEKIIRGISEKKDELKKRIDVLEKLITRTKISIKND